MRAGPRGGALAGLVAAALVAALGLLGLGSAPARAQGRARQISVLVDTSGSMKSNDPARYAVQLSKILADLQEPGRDGLSVVKLASGRETCANGPDPGVRLDLGSGGRAFEDRVDDALAYDNPFNNFVKAVRTSVDATGTDLSRDRLVLFLADADRFDNCEAQLYAELAAHRETGAMVAAITIGSGGRGAFYKHRSQFDYIEDAGNAGQMVQRLAEVYQQFLGSRRVQSGTLRPGGSVQVEVDPLVREAWLVVAADGELPALAEGSGNPGRAALDLDHRDGGRTVGLRGTTREYRIARIERPEAGAWTFSAPGMSAEAGWMLLQDFAITARLKSPSTVPRGQEVPLEIELINELTGKPLTDPRILRDVEVTTTLDGRTLVLRDDGTGGDRVSGDGVLTTLVRHDTPGSRPLPVRVKTASSEETVHVAQEVVAASLVVDFSLPPRVLVGEELGIRVLTRGGGGGEVAFPSTMSFAADTTVTLRDDGSGTGLGADDAPGDGTFSGSWTPSVQGPLTVRLTASGGDAMVPAEASTEVVGAVRFGPPRALVLGELGSGDEATATLDLGQAEVRGTVPLVLSTTVPADSAWIEAQVDGVWQPLSGGSVELLAQQGGPLAVPLRATVGECPDGLEAGDTVLVVVSGLTFGSGPEGQLLLEEGRLEVPVQLMVVEDSWLWCLRHLIAAAVALTILGILAFGYWWAAGFRTTWWVVFVEPDDPDEELTSQRIRSLRGSGKKPYVHARMYVSRGFKLQRGAGGAVARLQALAGGARVIPARGVRLLRLDSDDEWVEVPDEGRRLVLGELYREEGGSFLFKVVSRG